MSSLFIHPTHVHYEIPLDGDAAAEDAAHGDEEEPHDGHHERRHAPLVERVRVLAALEQEAEDLDAAVPGRGVDGGRADG